MTARASAHNDMRCSKFSLELTPQCSVLESVDSVHAFNGGNKCLVDATRDIDVFPFAVSDHSSSVADYDQRVETGLLPLARLLDYPFGDQRETV